MAQAATRTVKITYVMMRAEFWHGVQDKRMHRGFRDEYENWDKGQQFYYERGRQWAALAPALMPLRIGRRLNPQAVHVYRGVL